MIVSEAKALLVVRGGLFFLYTFQNFFLEHQHPISNQLPHRLSIPAGALSWARNPKSPNPSIFNSQIFPPPLASISIRARISLMSPN